MTSPCCASYRGCTSAPSSTSAWSCTPARWSSSRSCEAICAGDPTAGPMALAPPSERFHWLTAPRSDVLQSSPVHEGICDDPGRALDELFEQYVAVAHPGEHGDGC